MGMVADDEQVKAEAMWGGDINWTPRVEKRRSEDRLRRGREGFAQATVLRGVSVALWSKHESQKTIFYKAG
jgi:hypothetical protein